MPLPSGKLVIALPITCLGKFSMRNSSTYATGYQRDWASLGLRWGHGIILHGLVGFLVLGRRRPVPMVYRGAGEYNAQELAGRSAPENREEHRA